jgi:PTS system cellobiose-specific IIC component
LLYILLKYERKTMGKHKGTAKKDFVNFLEVKLMPKMAKMGTQRHLASIRDAFATITPLIIAGALSLLIVTAVFGGEDSTKISILGQIANWAHGIIDPKKGGE